jgi:hypothetical protein
MDDDSHVIDKGWDALPDYAKSGDADDAPTVSISTTPGEWLVNTTESVVVPMSMVEVVEALRHRKLTERSLVWRAGMQEWAPIDKVPQLKLAIRHAPSDLAAAQSAAGSSGPAHDAASSRVGSKSPPVRPSQPAHAQPAGLSRRSTLPFGLPNPNATARPSQPRLASPTAAPPPPPPPREEPEVLAVYARPAATISFDLSPSEPARVPPAAAAPPGPPPQTLAPTTSDALRPARVLSPRSSADLSVVAASQFREVQRSSKRLLWVSSLASAAAASVLTLWVSGAAPWTRLPAAPSKRAPQAEPAAAARLQPPAPAPAPAEPSPPLASVAAPPSTAAAAASIAPTPKAIATAAKPAARKARAVSMAPASQPKAAPTQPSAEPNPYDVKLDDETGQPSAKPAARGLLDMIQESEQKAAEVKPPEASATSSSSSPGF